MTSAKGDMRSVGIFLLLVGLGISLNTCPTGITTHNKSLQNGLDVKNKTQRVMHYAKNIQHDVGVIAHSCGADAPHFLRRDHCRIVQPNGLSIPLSELHPYVYPHTPDDTRSVA
ncbi:MAG: hypothetical protein F4Z01_09905 [Gammaproteobacteria bacterium]|nr:hypothetical protein [Gammaproteobacteria bacterium]MYF37232.1 hypothetical protein [Gammaproteobacteria bacterium]